MQDATSYKKYKGLAKAALRAFPPKTTVRADVLKNSLNKDMRDIANARKTAQVLEKKGEPLPAAFEWIADNYYVFEQRFLHLPRAFRGHNRLQGAMMKGENTASYPVPRFYAAFSEYLTLLDGPTDATALNAFIAACDNREENRPGFADYYSLALLFTLAVISRTAEICRALAENPYGASQAEAAKELGRYVVSLKHIGAHRFEKSFETCETEELLREDPAGFYPGMTRGTKDYYRSRVSLLSERAGESETDFVKGILEKARGATEGKGRHIGAYLYPEKSRIAGAAYFVILAALVLLVCLPLMFITPWALALIFPVWEAAKQITDRIFSRFVKTPPLPRLALTHIPDTDGVLVVVTTLLFGGKSDDAMFAKLEKLYLSNGMANVTFALLGDFADCPRADSAADEKILADAVDRVSALNAKYGGGFYLFLRPRRYSKTQRAFMGYERKRGAVMQLVQFLCGGENSFLSHKAEMPRSVCEKTRYVITLDADTNLPVDAVRGLAGAMLHPLNRPVLDRERHIVTDGYGIMQPRVAPELSAARQTGFARVMCGTGGIETYAFTQFDLYQSVFGDAIFCGKGIFDKYAFDAVINTAETAFPEETVLSHDILEGARLRTALAGDFEVTDGFPKNELSYFKRHHRWVRGDVQNLAFLGTNFVGNDGKRVKNNLSPLSKFKLFDNFRRAFVPVLAFFSLVAANFLSLRAAGLMVFFSLLHIFLPLVFDFLSLFRSLGFQCAARRFFSKGVTAGIWQSLLRALMGLAMLPANAVVTLDAALRSFWRMKVTRRNLLEWVTAAQSDASSDGGLLSYVQKNLAGAATGAGMFLFSPYGILKLIGLVWFFYPAAAHFNAREKRVGSVRADETQKERITAYCADMWRYFENTVDAGENFLPLDNLQLFPTEIRAHRTSPTNIGLYLACVLAARDFGFIGSEELYARLDATFGTVEKMEKWRGHLYNWYDTRTLALLAPRYISSVDSGNFLACLIVVSEGVKQYANEKPELVGISMRAKALFDGTDLNAVYNSERELFSLGVSVKNGEVSMSDHCYDMLMSEARTLSFVALAERKIPQTHWAALARPLVKSGDRVGLASWTGTAFEYFMPALFLPTVKGSLMYEALRFAFYCERGRMARTANGAHVWGISESGYFAFDSEMNYRYQAFGVPKLGFKRGLENDLVISPYSTFLALCLNVSLPLENLHRLTTAGAYGKFGFYEAYDFTPGRAGDSGALVKSYMSHHVGMSMLACANVCFDNVNVRRFMSDARMRSAKELLEEKIPVDAVVRRVTKNADEPDRPTRSVSHRRMSHEVTDVETPFCRVISDGFAGAVTTDSGFVRLYAGKNALCAADNEKYGVRKGFFTFFEYDGHVYSPAYLPLEKKEGTYRFEYDGAGFAHRYEDDVFVGKASYTVLSDHSVIAVSLKARVADRKKAPEGDVSAAFCFEPLIMPEMRFAAHPAFHSLFVLSQYDRENNLIVYERRVRADEAPMFLAVGFSDAGQSFEFSTRKGDVFSTPFSAPDYEKIFRVPLDGQTGTCLAPLCLVRTKLGAANGCTLLISSGDERERAVSSLVAARRENPARTAEKAENLEALMLMANGLMPDEATAGVLSEMTRRVLYPARHTPDPEKTVSTGRHCLWECGISGDLPILLYSVPTAGAARQAEIYIRSFMLLQKKKLAFDLVLLVTDSEKYRRPSENAALAAVERCGAGEYLKKSGGGLFVLNPDTLSDGGRALYAYSAGFCDEPPEIAEASYPGESAEFRTVPEPFAESSALIRDAETDGFVSGSGQFDEEGAYTVIKTGDTPPLLPQSMVLAGRMLGSVVTHNSFGYTFAGNAALRRITPFYNDPTEDMRGERLFLRQDDTFYDLAAMSARVRYGMGYALYEGKAGNTAYRVRVFIPEKLPIKVFEVDGKFPADSELVFAARPVMGERTGENRLCMFTMKEQRAEFTNVFSEYLAEYTGFVTCASQRARYEFPESGPFAGYALCLLSGTDVTGEGGCRFALGAYRTTSRMDELCKRMLAQKDETLYESAVCFSRSFVPTVSLCVKKDGEAVSDALRSAKVMFNFWLPYQNGICRMTARSGFYQSGGAYGFRDQLQDAVMLMYADPNAAKTHILRAAAHQVEDGGALHWWHPKAPQEVFPIAGSEFHRGIRSQCSDDYLWLIYAVSEYAAYTGDREFLKIPVRYAAGEELAEGEAERYILTRRSEKVESVYDHCVRALERGYARLGEKGLALLGSGDWSDGLNRAGEGLRGESVWLSMFLAQITKQFSAHCVPPEEEQTAARFEHLAAKLTEAVRKHGYDSRAGYFIRAWYDDGTPIGAPGSDECEIDLLPQAFAVFDGKFGDAAISAIQKAYEKLYDHDARIFRLLAPPFDRGARDPGYIKGYAPGVRENGGQYTHAAVWGTMALIEAACPAGNTDREMLLKGVDALFSLLPPLRCADHRLNTVYRAEPYVLCGDVYAGELAGRGGWSWYTGSAGWLWRAMLGTFFGLAVRLAEDGVVLHVAESAFHAPFVYGSGFEVKLSFPSRGVDCTVEYRKAEKSELLLDGKTASRKCMLSPGEHNITVGGSTSLNNT